MEQIGLVVRATVPRRKFPEARIWNGFPVQHLTDGATSKLGGAVNMVVREEAFDGAPKARFG